VRSPVPYSLPAADSLSDSHILKTRLTREDCFCKKRGFEEEEEEEERVN